MTFHRKLTLMTLIGLLAFAGAGGATGLAPFIDLQEQGLTLTNDAHGLMTWGGGPVSFNVNVAGPVRFALLYWAGRERPCALDGSGTNCPFAQPFKDQQMIFNGNPLTGTVIGSETQPVSGGGPILNVGYYADVTGIVSGAGPGVHNFTLSDGNGASNLWRLDGASLIIAYNDGTTWRPIAFWSRTASISPTAMIRPRARPASPLRSPSTTASTSRTVPRISCWWRATAKPAVPTTPRSATTRRCSTS